MPGFLVEGYSRLALNGGRSSVGKVTLKVSLLSYLSTIKN